MAGSRRGAAADDARGPDSSTALLQRHLCGMPRRSGMDFLVKERYGYVEKRRNATIEYRWVEGQYDRLPALAADLVGRQVAVDRRARSHTASLVALKAATPTIPLSCSRPATILSELAP